jgi:hypothetical protein
MTLLSGTSALIEELLAGDEFEPHIANNSSMTQ